MIPFAAERQNESASAHASAAGTLVVATAVVAAVVVNGAAGIVFRTVIFRDF